MSIVRIVPLALLGLTFSCQFSLDSKSDPEPVKVEAHKEMKLPAMDAPAVHPMVMLGDGPVYLSHQAMFHKPHDYQALFEVELVKFDDKTDPLSIYVKDRKEVGEKVYTMVPEKFSLPELFSSRPGLPLRTSFEATIYRGHYDHGGKPLLTHVMVHVKRVIYAKKLDANAKAPKHARYLVFGNDSELFAAHIINQKPDFDHLAAVRVPFGVIAPAQAAAITSGAVVEIPELEHDEVLKEGKSMNAKVHLSAKKSLDVDLDVIKSVYFEAGNLEE